MRSSRCNTSTRDNCSEGYRLCLTARQCQHSSTNFFFLLSHSLGDRWGTTMWWVLGNVAWRSPSLSMPDHSQNHPARWLALVLGTWLKEPSTWSGASSWKLIQPAMQNQHCHVAGSTGLHSAGSRESPWPDHPHMRTWNATISEPSTIWISRI